MKKLTLPERIIDFNKERDPDLLKIKYFELTTSSFRFLRGTDHLFYEDLATNNLFKDSPNLILCGDLHLENFGSYKGDDRKIYYDVNDFDESFLGPILYDVFRLATSIFLAESSYNIFKNNAKWLCESLLTTYKTTLEKGLVEAIHKGNANGVIKKLFKNVNSLKRKSLLLHYAQKEALKRGRKLFDGKRVGIHKKLQKVLNDFKIVDIALRANGTGSVGLERYLLLAEKKGKKFLLDCKEITEPSALRFVEVKQAKFKDRAERIITYQKSFQASPPAFLRSLKIGKKFYLLKELQHEDGKVDLAKINNISSVKKFVQDLARITAWGHLRSCKKKGADDLSEIIWYSKNLNIENVTISARDYSNITESYYRDWCEYYKISSGQL